MAGKNPYLDAPEAPVATRPFRVLVIGEDDRQVTIDVDPATLPNEEPGLPGSLLSILLGAGVDLEHSCGGVCACSTCHLWVTAGFASLTEAEDREQDILDKAFDVKPFSRLGCQAEVGTADVTAEITPESLQAWYDEHPTERHERDERLRSEGRAIPGPARDLRRS